MSTVYWMSFCWSSSFCKLLFLCPQFCWVSFSWMLWRHFKVWDDVAAKDFFSFSIFSAEKIVLEKFFLSFLSTCSDEGVSLKLDSRKILVPCQFVDSLFHRLAILSTCSNISSTLQPVIRSAETLYKCSLSFCQLLFQHLSFRQLFVSSTNHSVDVYFIDYPFHRLQLGQL